MTGDQLRSKRLKLNFTQKELGEKLRVAANTVARWERDELPIPPYLDLALKAIESEIAPKKK